MLPTHFELTLPGWLVDRFPSLPETWDDRRQRMEWVIELARANFERRTGGPFAAAVFESETGRLISVGVNRVEPMRTSIAHAEMVTLALAQTRQGTHDLGRPDLPPLELVVNARPCAMCAGAIPWSGIPTVVIAASGEEVESLAGFDEGPIHPDWRREFEKRGIKVEEGLLADKACQLFRDYAASDAARYQNPDRMPRRGR